MLCIAGGAAIVLLGNRPLPVDLAWFDFSNQTRSPQIEAASRFLNDAGAQVIVGVLVPVLAAILLSLRGRGWAALAVVLCGISSAPLVNLIKSFLERPRPDDQLVSVTLSAYPSGHVANLAAVVVVLGFADQLGRCDRFGRVISHDFVLMSETDPQARSLATRFDLVWTLVEDEIRPQV